MSELLSSVSEHLLAPGGVTIESLQTVLGDLAKTEAGQKQLYGGLITVLLRLVRSPSVRSG